MITLMIILLAIVIIATVVAAIATAIGVIALPILDIVVAVFLIGCIIKLLSWASGDSKKNKKDKES